MKVAEARVVAVGWTKMGRVPRCFEGGEWTVFLDGLELGGF